MSSADVPPATPPPAGATGPSTSTDDRHQALLEDLTTRMGDAIVGSHVRNGDLWVRVRRDAWLAAAQECRAMSFDYFCYLSAIDWLPHTWPNPKVIEGVAPDPDDESALPVEEEVVEEPAPAAGDGSNTGFAGGDTRFQVLARLYSTVRHIGLTLKADLDDDTPRVDSWISVYPGADWCERETWEMYGFDFVGHPNLTHLYLPGEFEGFPLRKDFPLLAREVKPWPGLVDVEQFPASYEATQAAGEAEA